MHVKALSAREGCRLFVGPRDEGARDLPEWVERCVGPATLGRSQGSDRLLVARLKHRSWLEDPPLDAIELDHVVLEADGEARFRVAGSRAEVDGLLQALSTEGREAMLESLGESKAPEDPVQGLLTERQREILAVALREGCFEVPRRVTLGELAATVGVRSATLSGILRRTQRRLAERVLDETGPTAPQENEAPHTEGVLGNRPRPSGGGSRPWARTRPRSPSSAWAPRPAGCRRSPSCSPSSPPTRAWRSSSSSTSAPSTGASSPRSWPGAT